METSIEHQSAPERAEPQKQKCLKPWNWRCTFWPLVFVAIALLTFPWTATVYHYFHKTLRSLPLSSLFDTAVELTSWPIVLIIIVSIYRLDRAHSRFVGYLLCALLATSLVNGPIKQIAGRSRPEWSVSMSKNKRLELVQFNARRTAFQVPLTKTDHWFGPAMARPYFMDRYASFPSGHAAAAFAIAAFLCALYPSVRWLWLCAAIACALSRVYGARHYPEDVMVGGAIGWVVAHWTFAWQWPLALQDRFVGWCRRRNTQPKHDDI